MRKIHTKQGGATPTAPPPPPLACRECSFWGNNRNASSTLAHKGAMGDGRWAVSVGGNAHALGQNRPKAAVTLN